MSRRSPAYYGIPDYMAEGIHRYITEKILPGSFLTAVLENDLRNACGCADATNQRLIFNYVDYLYNEAPSQCWGSPEKVAAWIETAPESLPGHERPRDYQEESARRGFTDESDV